jgi:hypothetical protein
MGARFAKNPQPSASIGPNKTSTLCSQLQPRISHGEHGAFGFEVIERLGKLEALSAFSRYCSIRFGMRPSPIV